VADKGCGTCMSAGRTAEAIVRRAVKIIHGSIGL